MASDHDMTSASQAWSRHRAARTVAHHAHDANDLAEFLAMLGLTAVEGRNPPEELCEPTPRTPPPRLDLSSACRLTLVLRSRGTDTAG